MGLKFERKLNMSKCIDRKVVRGESVEVIESMGFLGGIDYNLVVDGRVKKSSKDLNYILGEFARY